MAYVPNDGEYVWDNTLRAILDSCNNTSVVSGMSVTQRAAGINQSVDVAAGVYLVGGTRVVYAISGNIAAPAADVNNPRKDILVADNAGALTFIQGTAASALPTGEIGVRTYQPVPPNIPASRVILAEIYRAANDNTIANADITEKFIIVPSRMIGRELLTAQGQVIYASAAQTPVVLAPGANGQYLQTQGAGANPQWANGTITIVDQAQGDIVYYTGAAWTRLSAGTNGYFLKTQGAGANPIWSLLNPVTFNEYTSNDTWTKPSGISLVVVECVGGGGNGGYGRSNLANYDGGGGGGGGAITRQFFDAADLAATVAITVGAGGGNTSNFGTHLYAYGGGQGGVADDSDAKGGGGGGGTGSAGNFGGSAGGNGGNPTIQGSTHGDSLGGRGAKGGAGGVGAAAQDGYNAEYGGGGGGGSKRDSIGRAGGSSIYSAGGGGAGGDGSTGDTGGAGGVHGSYSAGGGGAGGIGGVGVPGGTGGNGTSRGYGGGNGGGGGGGSDAGNGGTGGTGGSPGGGGGGGGGSVGGLGGAGGSGSAGVVRVWSW